jgi:hypothetical protein
VKTYITYNKGRDWRLLQAPDVDLRGSPVHCLLVSHPVSCGVTGQAGPMGMLLKGFLTPRGLWNLAAAEQQFPTTVRMLVYRLRLPHQLVEGLDELHRILLRKSNVIQLIVR